MTVDEIAAIKKSLANQTQTNESLGLLRDKAFEEFKYKMEGRTDSLGHRMEHVETIEQKIAALRNATTTTQELMLETKENIQKTFTKM